MFDDPISWCWNICTLLLFRALDFCSVVSRLMAYDLFHILGNMGNLIFFRCRQWDNRMINIPTTINPKRCNGGKVHGKRNIQMRRRSFRAERLNELTDILAWLSSWQPHQWWRAMIISLPGWYSWYTNAWWPSGYINVKGKRRISLLYALICLICPLVFPERLTNNQPLGQSSTVTSCWCYANKTQFQ